MPDGRRPEQRRFDLHRSKVVFPVDFAPHGHVVQLEEAPPGPEAATGDARVLAPCVWPSVGWGGARVQGLKESRSRDAKEW